MSNLTVKCIIINSSHSSSQRRTTRTCVHNTAGLDCVAIRHSCGALGHELINWNARCSRSHTHIHTDTQYYTKYRVYKLSNIRICDIHTHVGITRVSRIPNELAAISPLVRVLLLLLLLLAASAGSPPPETRMRSITFRSHRLGAFAGERSPANNNTYK